jgi:hypothetical protein
LKQAIDSDFLQIVAGDIEKLLLESQQNINFSFNKIPDGIKLSLGINLDQSSAGIVASYTLSFDLEPKPDAPEKYKTNYKHTINTLQTTICEVV